MRTVCKWQPFSKLQTWSGELRKARDSQQRSEWTALLASHKVREPLVYLVAAALLDQLMRQLRNEARLHDR